MWIDSGGTKKLKDIAAELEVSETQVRKWKNQDRWNSNVTNPNSNVTKRKHGGQPGNKNAAGHGAPKRNKNAEKYGFFSKYLPEETVSIIQEMPQDPLDVLWDQIQIAYAAIIRAQQIMYVRDAEDKTVEKIERKDGNVIGEKWEVQQAWDKQASFLSAQARAQKTLEGMINRYEELLHKNWKLATREQKARIAVLKSKVATDGESTESQIASYLDKLEEAVRE
ncbi:MAG: phage terminase small subunit [Dorea phocaeensis]